MGINLAFDNIPDEVVAYLFLAAGLRLGVIPPHLQFLQENPIRRGLGTLMRFVPVSASIILLVRASHAQVADSWQQIFIFIAAFVALISSFFWLQADSELQSRPYWILGLGSFALAAATQGEPVASASWGLALLFSGALLFLFSIKSNWLMGLIGFGVLGFSSLPLTPNWEGSLLFGSIHWGVRIVLLTALSLFILGYLRFGLRSGSTNEQIERWMWIVYPVGLLILPLSHFGLIYIKWGMGLQQISFGSQGWWSGLIPIGLAVIFIVWDRKRPINGSLISTQFPKFFDLNWMYRLLWFLYRNVGKLFETFTRLFEGDGGVLWALIILMMLIVTINLWSFGIEFEF
jgi:hypothetical protein